MDEYVKGYRVQIISESKYGHMDVASFSLPNMEGALRCIRTFKPKRNYHVYRFIVEENRELV